MGLARLKTKEHPVTNHSLLRSEHGVSTSRCCLFRSPFLRSPTEARHDYYRYIHPLRAFSFRYFSMHREISRVLLVPTPIMHHMYLHLPSIESPSGSRIQNPTSLYSRLAGFERDTCTYFNPFQIYPEQMKFRDECASSKFCLCEM